MSPDPLTLNQRAALEAKMTDQAHKHLAELAKANSRTAGEIDRLERNIQALKITVIVCLVAMAGVLVLLFAERAQRNIFGPFRVGYSPKGSLALPENLQRDGVSHWDYCMSAELTLDAPIICIWAPAPPAPDVLDPGSRVEPTPSNFAKPATDTIASMLPSTERRAVPQPTNPTSLQASPARVKPRPYPLCCPPVSNQRNADLGGSHRLQMPPLPRSEVDSTEGRVERIVSAGGLCGVPASIALRLAARESGMRHLDKRGRVLRSASGAVGILQVKRTSAAEVSPTLNIEREWDNLLAGFCYLSSRRGDWPTKVRSYRVGARGKSTPAIDAYVSSVMEGFEQ